VEPADAAPSAPAPVLARKSTPAERRKADEAACLGGNVDACRRMADRYRGYGHPAGCGLDREPPLQSVRTSGGGASWQVRIKRTAQDSDADEQGFQTWNARACDLGDANACQIERAGSDIFRYVSPASADDMAVRSDPSSSALWAWQKATAPKRFPELESTRKDCLSNPWNCAFAAPAMYRRGDAPAPAELSPEARAQAEAICEKTLDCKSVLMMLDKNGHAPEALAPLHAHAAKVLTSACLEGACVCGDAARELPLDDPRVLDLARMGCENGEVEGCYALGRLYEEGRGVPRDVVAARSLYDIACPPMRPADETRTGDYSPRACDRLAEIYEAGAMPPKDVGRARYYAELACMRPGFERDHAPCVRLARYWASYAVTSGCVEVGELRCLSQSEEAGVRFYGPNSPIVGGRECQRPSVKALCDTYKKELDAMLKQGKKP
jgi:TPR repeat protein